MGEGKGGNFWGVGGTTIFSGGGGGEQLLNEVPGVPPFCIKDCYRLSQLAFSIIYSLWSQECSMFIFMI